MNKNNTHREEIIKKLLENGFYISENKSRDRCVDISKKNRPDVKEKLRKIIEFYDTY